MWDLFTGFKSGELIEFFLPFRLMRSPGEERQKYVPRSVLRRQYFGKNVCFYFLCLNIISVVREEQTRRDRVAGEAHYLDW